MQRQRGTGGGSSWKLSVVCGLEGTSASPSKLPPPEGKSGPTGETEETLSPALHQSLLAF